MSRQMEVVVARDYSPEEFIEGIENFLLRPDQEFAIGHEKDEDGRWPTIYAYVDLVNRDQEVISPDGTHQCDEFPFIRISKELEGDETKYIIRRGSYAHAAYQTSSDNQPGDWRETRYIAKGAVLYKETRGQEQLNDGVSHAAIVRWSKEQQVPQDELNETHVRLLSSQFERRSDHEARQLGPTLKRLGSKILVFAGLSSKD